VATLAALIGAGGLGEFIFRGIAMVDTKMVLMGALPAALLALVLDGLLSVLERRATPAALRKPSAGL
jgi:osmoprotectant transport system permease protein